MTDLEPDLHRVLREATEHVASPGLVPRALADARRRRSRRATAGVLTAALLLGGGAALAVQDREPRADVVDTPSPGPTPTPTPTVLDTDPATQPVWDPFTIVDAPHVPSRLPQQLVPPVDPPSLSDQPLPAVVLAWPEQGVDLRVLGTDGEWRRVPGTADAIRGTFLDMVVPVVSPAGDRMAMSTDAGILVVDVTTGERQVLAWPSELAGPVDGRPRLIWLPDDRGFLVLHWREPWLMDLDGGAEAAPYAGRYGAGLMVDPDTGTVRERRWQNGTVRTWEGDEVASSIRLGGYGERFVTRFSQVAYVGNPGASTGVLKSGPAVVDATTGEVEGFAPIRDPNAVYSDNANLTPLGLVDESTVLLLVSPMDYRTMSPDDGTTHLATWNHVTGDFGLVASGGPGMRTITVAVDLLLE